MKRFTLVSIAFLFTLPCSLRLISTPSWTSLNVGLAERGREHDDYNAMGQAKKSLDSQQHDVELDSNNGTKHSQPTRSGWQTGSESKTPIKLTSPVTLSWLRITPRK